MEMIAQKAQEITTLEDRIAIMEIKIKDLEERVEKQRDYSVGLYKLFEA